MSTVPLSAATLEENAASQAAIRRASRAGRAKAGSGADGADAEGLGIAIDVANMTEDQLKG
jgi:hypothetical protein